MLRNIALSRHKIFQSSHKMFSNGETDPVVQYIVIRSDLMSNLNWTLGAVVAQACHASVAAVAKYKEDDKVVEYITNLNRMHKVVLRVDSTDELENLSDKLASNGVLHHLWIEEPETVPTCLASKPGLKSSLASHFKGLKLLK